MVGQYIDTTEVHCKHSAAKKTTAQCSRGQHSSSTKQLRLRIAEFTYHKPVMGKRLRSEFQGLNCELLAVLSFGVQYAFCGLHCERW